MGDVVALALPEGLAVIEDAAPGVVVRVDGAAEGYRDLLAARETVHELAADALETGLVDLAARLFRVEALGLDAELLLRVLLVAEDEVAAFHEGGHDPQETFTPISLATLMASRQASAAPWLSAGVMPVQWNQSAPSRTLRQSTMPGWISEMAEWARS